MNNISDDLHSNHSHANWRVELHSPWYFCRLILNQKVRCQNRMAKLVMKEMKTMRITTLVKETSEEGDEDYKSDDEGYGGQEDYRNNYDIGDDFW